MLFPFKIEVAWFAFACFCWLFLPSEKLLAFPDHGSCAERPNVVVILADDLGWGAVSYHSDFAETPCLDRFVASGIELDQFYVAPMCSPTRAGLLTGRYPIRFGLARAVIPPQRNFGLPTTEVSLPEVLANAGYQRRGVFGKWHLGHHQIKWHPLSRGFTHFEGHYNGAIDYFDLTRDGQRDWHEGYQPSEKQGYSTDLIADAAVRFIEESAAETDPYFCYVPFNAPHSPFQAPQEAIARYQKDGNVAQVNRLKAMIWSLDQGIGKILEAIERSGESDNTQVWIFSDNGGVSQFKGNNLPLRGSKLTTFEGGIRVVASVRWPLKWQGQRKLRNTMGYIDIFPTILESAGLSPEADRTGGQALDGISLGSLLEGRSSTLPEREWYSYHGQAGAEKETIAVRTADWKLVVVGPDIGQNAIGQKHKVFLFEICKDPHETVNVADQYPELVADLSRRLVNHRKLQPENSIPVFGVGKKNFQPWKNWDIRSR
ncbi:MAG: sulfatase-like hydrolase/transferase [Mariniblastus sp.]|nr:sulfatase-like hydrolase/transferase [Mariniblastus sp.]